MLPALWMGLWQALTTLAVSLPLAVVLGGPLGVLLYQRERAPPSPLAQAVHGLCSLPFVLMMLAAIALLENLIGNRPFALALAAIPYFARLVASSLRTVPRGLVETAQAMGASPLQIVTRVLLPEARPALMLAATLLAASLLAYQTLARVAFGGDHVRLAIALAILAAQVHLMQLAGERLARRLGWG